MATILLFQIYVLQIPAEEFSLVFFLPVPAAVQCFFPAVVQLPALLLTHGGVETAISLPGALQIRFGPKSGG